MTWQAWCIWPSRKVDAVDKKKGAGGGEKKKLISEMGGVNLNMTGGMKGGVRDGHAVGHGADMREAGAYTRPLSAQSKRFLWDRACV